MSRRMRVAALVLAPIFVLGLSLIGTNVVAQQYFHEHPAPKGWKFAGHALWFPQSGQPKGWDWSSREAQSLDECAKLCPHYRPTYGCQAFFFRPAGPGERSGRCDLHNFDRDHGLKVEKDTIHGKDKWDYYETIGASDPSGCSANMQGAGCGM